MRKYIFSFFIFLQLISSIATAQQKVTFAVEKIEVAKDTLKTLSYQQGLEYLFGRKIEAFPTEKKNIRLIPIASNGGNAFIETLHTAYYEHRPLVFSPDMIWLLICQGFSIHINENSKKFQNQISKHKSKKKIEIVRQEFEKGKDNDWSSVFNQFADSIKTNTKENIYELIVANFSTTSKVEKIAYQITLMETLKKYIELDVETGCGIHSITIEGTPEDWQKLKERTLLLRKYDLEVWVDGLLPILDEFILASQNKPNSSFWANIYKHVSFYGSNYVSGWIIKFFPYLEYSESVNGEIKAYYLKNDYAYQEEYYLSEISKGELSHGLMSYSFNWKDLKLNKTYSMVANAGFIGCTQDKNTKALRPEIGWLVRDKNAAYKNLKFKQITKKYLEEDTTNAWLPMFSSNPTEKPLFCPDSCKTVQESDKMLQKYLKQEIERIKTNNNEILEGIVNIDFVITWSGTVSNITITQKANDLAAQKAIKLVRNMPRWKPARDRVENLDIRIVGLAFETLCSINYKQSLVIDFGK